MRAFVLDRPGPVESLRLAEMPQPQPKSGEVRLRVMAVALNPVDYKIASRGHADWAYPFILGLDVAGVIDAVGEGVTGWKAGDRVTFDATVSCGRCAFCRRGDINLCNNRQVLGVSCGDYRRNGAFAEYVAVPENILYRLPGGLSFDHAAMIEAVSI
jgi:L-iditol 2-dehydrogenase